MLLLMSFGLLTSCGAELACTTEFRYFTVNIEDSQGLAVDDAVTETVIEASGTKLLTDRNVDLSAEGRYILVDDNASNVLAVGKTPVLFSVSARGKTKVTRYVVENSACHVEGYEGPARVTFE